MSAENGRSPRVDATRKYVLDRARERGTNLKSLSRQIGRNDSYLQQFVEYGKPKRLPEDVRAHLAQLLDVDETVLGAPVKKNLEKGQDTTREFFMLKEIALLAGAAYGGGIDEAEWNIPEGGWVRQVVAPFRLFARLLPIASLIGLCL